MTDGALKKSFRLPPIDEAAILRYLKVKSADDRLLSLLSSVFTEAEGIFTGDVVYGRFPLSVSGDGVDLGFLKAESYDLAKCLAGCDEVIVFTATVGHALDRLLRRYGTVSPTRALVLQALGTERIEALCDLFCADIELSLQGEGKRLTPRFSPGYGDLALPLQKDIFRALDAEKKLGVSLTEGFLMLPTKTVSAIVGIKAE